MIVSQSTTLNYCMLPRWRESLRSWQSLLFRVLDISASLLKCTLLKAVLLSTLPGNIVFAWNVCCKKNSRHQTYDIIIVVVFVLTMNDKIQYVPWLTAVFLERFFLIVDTSVLAWECCWSDVISITLAKLIDLHAEFKSSVPRKTPTIYFYRTFTGLHKAGWFWFPFQLVFL